MNLFSTAWIDGAVRGHQEIGIPLRGWHVVGRNHYRYEAQEMAEFTSEEEAKQSGAAIEAAMRPEMGRLMERWDNEHLPAIRALSDRLAGLSDKVAASNNVPALIDDALAAYAELWRIHFTIVIPMSVAMQVFDEFHAEVFGGGEEGGHPLLAGQLNESVKASLGLSDLAQRAHSLGVAGIILENEPHDALGALATTVSGRAFLDDLAAYLVSYGLRQDLFDLATPTWREQPAYAMTNVRNYLRTGLDARAHHGAIEARTREARERARADLVQYPQAVRDQFEAMLAMGEAASFLQEEHNFHIDQVGMAWTRLFFVEVGKRLVDAAAIDAADDVFMLSLDEIRAAFQEPLSLRGTVNIRRHELAAAQLLTPPPFIGTPPTAPPSTASPGERSMVRFFGLATPVSDDPDRVVGNPGARGTATGLARVVRTLDEAESLQPGEILVTVTTMPPWSPLFAVAAGVVTETGGPLSHCAIVAREYGIPAVVGAPEATRRIATGQRITIDGSTGIIELHG